VARISHDQRPGSVDCTRLAASALCAAAFAWSGVPLGWILGAMAGAALFGNTVGIAGRTRNLRRAGQLLVGTATAGVLTPALLDTMGELLPAMVGAAIAANAFGLLLAWPLARIAGTDRTTALLASLPAGMAEMASLAKQVNARTEVVTVVHTLRVILVVICIPIFLGVSGSGAPVAVDNGGSMAALIACLGLGLALALLADRIGLLNPYIIMPMLVGIVFVMGGFSNCPDAIASADRRTGVDRILARGPFQAGRSCAHAQGSARGRGLRPGADRVHGAGGGATHKCAYRDGICPCWFWGLPRAVWAK
jgi:membrane AbrB-like protein